ncbi:hypothetical protein GCM10023215_50520 [Pseudonocardia yuanmonensis]|uniref:FAD binding domain-containing protein n=1 Tax=Pseudonocardia yuanmonensis TaxID=1095914 RepID=A0ABP8XBA5_9PSEU
MKVRVIGAGIGGLAVAAGLRRAGADVVVLERSPELRPVGAGISLWANAFTALDVLGPGRAVRARTSSAPVNETGEALDAALDRYDALRRPRTARLMRASRRVGAVAQASSPVAVGLRDLALRLTPGVLADVPLRRVQAWQPPAERPGAASLSHAPDQRP